MRSQKEISKKARCSEKPANDHVSQTVSGLVREFTEMLGSGEAWIKSWHVELIFPSHVFVFVMFGVCNIYTTYRSTCKGYNPCYVRPLETRVNFVEYRSSKPPGRLDRLPHALIPPLSIKLDSTWFLYGPLFEPERRSVLELIDSLRGRRGSYGAGPVFDRWAAKQPWRN